MKTMPSDEGTPVGAAGRNPPPTAGCGVWPCPGAKCAAPALAPPSAAVDDARLCCFKSSSVVAAASVAVLSIIWSIRSPAAASGSTMRSPVGPAPSCPSGSPSPSGRARGPRPPAAARPFLASRFARDLLAHWNPMWSSSSSFSAAAELLAPPLFAAEPTPPSGSIVPASEVMSKKFVGKLSLVLELVLLVAAPSAPGPAGAAVAPT
mmetsp:Transcript_13393/g.32823  ORF Transcript_13393/g.32823 Transcript_13393/m.32823 type:complete len:207 (-) Transcript_13393:1269-1889(-)